MINYKIGDLFNDNAEAIVNTVNCVGVMGRGIALQFKKRYPENFKEYEAECKRGEMIPGRVFVFETNSLINPKFIINFPTKRHWRGASRIEDIESGLKDLVRTIEKYKIKSIAIPPLGSGLGELDWYLVKSKIEEILSELSDVVINVYEPAGAPEAKDMVRNRKVPKMTPGRAALVELVHSYLNGLLDPHISLLEIHKLLYFLQVDGEDLRLEFTKGPYGPYSLNLQHVLNAMEGHMLMGYADGGNNPGKKLELIPGAVNDAEEFMKEQPKTQKHISRVVELVDGFETSFGLELLSTVHWIANEQANSLDDIYKGFYAWGKHKKQFDTRQINIALQRLILLKWIDETLMQKIASDVKDAIDDGLRHQKKQNSKEISVCNVFK